MFLRHITPKTILQKLKIAEAMTTQKKMTDTIIKITNPYNLIRLYQIVPRQLQKEYKKTLNNNVTQIYHR